MSNPKGEWTDLFLAFRFSLDPRKLWLAFKGIVLSIVLVGIVLAVLAMLYHAQGVRFSVERVSKGEGRHTRTVWRRHPMPLGERVVSATGRVLDSDACDVWGGLRRLRLGDAVRATRDFPVALCQAARAEVHERLEAGVPRRYALLRILWLSDALADLAIVALLCLLVLLLIWSYYYVAIMRVAAVEYALGERIELRSAAAYAWRKHHVSYGAPLGLAAAILLLALCVLLVGLVAWNILAVMIVAVGFLGAVVVGSVLRDRTRSAWAGLGGGVGTVAVALLLAWLVAHNEWRIPILGELALALLLPLILFAGLAMALLGIWLVFGSPLMAGAVSSRDCDVFEAWSRSFHYLFTHPWRYAFYALVATAHGTACLGFVYLVRAATEWATLLPLSAGLLGRFEAVYHQMVLNQAGAGATAGDAVLALVLALGRFALDLAFLSFVAAYVFTAATIAYFLLRRRADGTPVSEVHLEPRDRELLQPAPPARPEAATEAPNA